MDALSALPKMPATVLNRLQTGRDSMLEYLSIWADCMDYGLGREDVFATAPGGFAKQLFASANSQLDAAVSLLLEKRPNPKAMESARFATEMFLKAFIGFHRGLTENEARAIGHDLTRALDACLGVQPSSELAELRPRLPQFPAVGARYEGKGYSRWDLWFCYGTAQYAGSAVVRSLTDRHMRKQVEDYLKQVQSAQAGDT